MESEDSDSAPKPVDRNRTRAKRLPAGIGNQLARYMQDIDGNPDNEEEQIQETEADKNDKDYDPKHDAKHVVPKTPKPRKQRWEFLQLPELRKEHKKQRDELDEFKRINTELRAARRCDRKRFLEETNQRKQFQQQWKQANQKIGALQTELGQQAAELDARFTQQQNNFARAETRLLAMVKRDSYPVLPDNVIRDRFKACTSACKDWAREWCSSEAHWQSLKRSIDILTFCLQNEEIVDNTRLFKHLRDMGPTAYRLMAYAFVVRSMLAAFFVDPFMLVASFDGQRATSEVFRALYEAFSLVDEKKALSWRSETIRLLKEELGKDSTRLIDHCTTMATSCILGLGSYILRSVDAQESQKRSVDLSEIVLQFAKLSLEVWCHKCKICTVDVSTIRNKKFERQSELYVPHNWMALEDDDFSLDGAQIQIVMTPAIEAWGNSHGDNLQAAKVWHPATVLLFRQPRPNVLLQEDTLNAARIQPPELYERPENDISPSPPTKRVKLNNHFSWPSRATCAVEEPVRQQRDQYLDARDDAGYQRRRATSTNDINSRQADNEEVKRNSTPTTIVTKGPHSSMVSNSTQRSARTILNPPCSGFAQLVAQVEGGNTVDKVEEQRKAQNMNLNQTAKAKSNIDESSKVGRNQKGDETGVQPSARTSETGKTQRSAETGDEHNTETFEDCVIVKVKANPVERGST